MPDLWHGDVQDFGRQSRHQCDAGQSADHELIMPQPTRLCHHHALFAYKSRTGGILSRLISRTGLDLAAMRMFAPGAGLVKQYAETIVSAMTRKIGESRNCFANTSSKILTTRPQDRSASPGDDTPVPRR